MAGMSSAVGNNWAKDFILFLFAFLWLDKFSLSPDLPHTVYSMMSRMTFNPDASASRPKCLGSRHAGIQLWPIMPGLSQEL